ncbi:uncharacterized protein LY79DRAFT_298938 [Colletotrichum navitas]|uniref:Uncharacterized protein n=1 Tax=Colletotrichum navitas TaxID=681940 RepID=A0AAD8PVB2_9PEZI|nr:uncharacterized protein LY79DRAFT_298938 [Colletotrichum navitas]KAK1580618.1 hypothetical protein LY79DRAFT_298938 [Colletotrichum navitas]
MGSAPGAGAGAGVKGAAAKLLTAVCRAVGCRVERILFLWAVQYTYLHLVCRAVSTRRRPNIPFDGAGGCHQPVPFRAWLVVQPAPSREHHRVTMRILYSVTTSRNLRGCQGRGTQCAGAREARSASSSSSSSSTSSTSSSSSPPCPPPLPPVLPPGPPLLLCAPLPPPPRPGSVHRRGPVLAVPLTFLLSPPPFFLTFLGSLARGERTKRAPKTQFGLG